MPAIVARRLSFCPISVSFERVISAHKVELTLDFPTFCCTYHSPVEAEPNSLAPTLGAKSIGESFPPLSWNQRETNDSERLTHRPFTHAPILRTAEGYLISLWKRWERPTLIMPPSQALEAPQT